MKAAPNALFRKLHDGSFGIVEDFFGGIALVGSAGNGGVGDVNQSPQQRLVAHDLDVMLDARPVRNAVQQARDVADVANRLQFLAPVQFLDQRDHVNRTRRLRQIDHARVNAAMRIEREIFRLQMLGSLVVGKIVEQNRAQNRALGFHVGRQSVSRDCSQ